MFGGLSDRWSDVFKNHPRVDVETLDDDSIIAEVIQDSVEVQSLQQRIAELEDEIVRLKKSAGTTATNFFEDIAGELDEVTSVSGTHVKAVGCDLNAIVTSVKAYVDENNEKFIEEIEHQEKKMNAFLATTQKIIKKQNIVVESVEEAVSKIQNSLTSIHYVNESTTLLALNARIEAARLGDMGRAFGIIAQEMRSLSLGIDGVTGDVSSASDSIIELLPEVVASAKELEDETKVLFQSKDEKEAEASTEVIGEVESRMTDIIRLLNSALSHLQFQDVIAQKISKMEKRFDPIAQQLFNGVDDKIETNIDTLEIREENLRAGSGIMFGDEDSGLTPLIEDGINSGDFLLFDEQEDEEPEKIDALDEGSCLMFDDDDDLGPDTEPEAGEFIDFDD